MIANPEAGRRSSQGILDRAREEAGRRGFARFEQTSSPGDEEQLTALAIAAGANVIIAVGGDGTCTRIANAILRLGAPCRLAVVPSGTGNDFAKTLGVDRYTPEYVADLVVGKEATRIDVGFADGQYFLNSCGFGFDASVLEASNHVRLLKGDAVYIYSALRQLFTYQGIEVAASGVAGVTRKRMLMVTVSNGRWLGGAFKIAPHASLLDGKLDACFVSDSNIVERVKLFVGAMRGTHLGMPSVTAASIQQLALTFASSPSMEVDGELRKARSPTVELRCVPRALSVVAAPGALT